MTSLSEGTLVEYHGGGVGDRGWPTTRGFVVIVVGHRRVWEVRAMGGVRSICRRVGGVYHSKTNEQARPHVTLRTSAVRHPQ
jgi:hypothetical protein